MDKLFDIFKQLLDIHIQTKTIDSQFHEKSAEFYQIIFDCYHEIGEKMIDTEKMQPMDDEEVYNKTYDLIEEAKGIVGNMLAKDTTVGMDNLLRGLIDKLESNCGNARAFVSMEKDEYEETEDTEMPQEIKKMKSLLSY